ncbi:aspartate carbamoyltransferase catalytic subunit [Myxococcota bacterium]|nr:aspartate carbamoyltransferase catalytic subunit [Myxococcota bacterium]
MSFARKDLVGIADLEEHEILTLLDTAERFRELNERPIKKVPTLRGRSVIHLFLEPSTRTRTSFDIAAKRMSADTFSVGGVTSSAVKGETLLDTARNLHAMRPDVIVVRHKMAGTAALLAKALPCSVINAGDGFHEHPTQALLDALTLRQRLGGFEGRTVTIVGDIAHSRVARSNVILLTRLGARVRVCGPRTLIPPGIEALGAVACDRLRDAIEDADVVMMLRIQQERIDQGGHYFPNTREYSRLYGLNLDTMRRARPDVLVMHPGPVNRGVEISPEVADGPWSVILDQVTNGVAVRMSAMYHVMGADRAEAAVQRGADR